MTVVSLNIAPFAEVFFHKKSYSSLNFEALIEIMQKGVESAIQQEIVCLIGCFSRNQ